MAVLLLVASTLAQAGTTYFAVRLARSRRRLGWVFIAIASTLMLVRRLVRLAEDWQGSGMLDAVEESIALFISLLFMTGFGILLMWDIRLFPGENQDKSRKESDLGRQLLREGLLLGVFSLCGIGLLTYFTYRQFREESAGRLAKASLEIAQTLRVTAARASQGDPTQINRQIEELWSTMHTDDDARYLCIIGPGDKLTVNTSRPDRVGVYVGDNELGRDGQSGSRTVAELRKSRGNWAGPNRNASGFPQIAGYAYAPENDSLVVVHVPQKIIDREFWQGNVLVGLGAMVLVGLGFPISLFFFYGQARRAHENAVKEMRRRLLADEHARRIVQSSEEGIWTIDAEARTTFVNPKMAKMLGYSCDEMLGHPLTDFMDEEGRTITTQNLERRRQGIAEEHEFKFLHKNGTEFWARLTTNPIYDNKKNYIGALAMVTDITERKQAEEALRKSEANYRALFESAADGIYISDAQGHYLDVNVQGYRMLGYTREEILALGVRDIIAENEHGRLEAELERLRAGKVVRSEWQCRRKDGTLFPCEVSATVLPDGRFLAIRRDITVQRRVDAAIRESEQKLRKVIDGLGPNNFVGLLSLDGKVVEANNPALAPAGLRIEDVVGQPVDQTYWFAHSEPVQAQLRAAVARAATGEPSRYDVQIRVAEDRLIWLDFSIYPYRDEDNQVVYLVPSATVIDQRKQAEVRVKQLNRTYAVLSDINQLIVRERDPQAILRSACRIAVEKGGFLLAWVGQIDPQTKHFAITSHAGATPDILGILEKLYRDQAIGCVFTARAIETGAHAVCNDIAKDQLAEPWRDAALQRGYRSMISLPLTVSGGRAGIFNLYADQPDFFDEEELRLLDELAMDISFALEISQRESERLLAEDKLREEQRLYAALASATTDHIYFKDREGRFIRVSREMARHFNLKDPSEVMGKTDRDFFNEEHVRKAREDELKILDTGEPMVGVEEKETWLDGHVTWVSTTKVALRNDQGQITGLVGISRDITERRLLEEQLRQSQKMEAVGQLSGGIAHDFNNLLTAIIGHLGLLKENPQVTPEIAESLGEISAAANRAANLTSQLLLFSRRQVMTTKELDLNEVVTNLTKMLRRILGEDVSMQLDHAPEQLTIHGDAGMIDQVLVNLAVNARDAMPEGGTLRISTRGEICMPPAGARQSNPTHPTAYVRLSISDTGTGIPDAIKSKIFDPFFTTKDVGKGTGLGLATVFGIVQQHRGWIEMESEIGQGTTFHVFLPRSAKNITPQMIEVVVPPARGQGELILLVEDEPSVMAVGVLALRRFGYKVLAAANGHEAIEVWAKNKTEIALLLTDMIMPQGISGLQLARQLLAQKPTLKIVYSSGYSAEIAGKEITLQDGVNYLAKPYELDRLLRTVRAALDGGESHPPFEEK